MVLVTSLLRIKQTREGVRVSGKTVFMSCISPYQKVVAIEKEAFRLPSTMIDLPTNLLRLVLHTQDILGKLHCDRRTVQRG